MFVPKRALFPGATHCRGRNLITTQTVPAPIS